MRFLALLFFAPLLLAQSQPEIARRSLDLLLTGKYSELAATFTPEMKAGLPESVLSQQLGPQIKSFGMVDSIGAPKVGKAKEFDLFVFPVHFSKFAFDFELALNAAHQVAGLHLSPAAPAWQPPPYNKPGSYTERDVTVGADQWKLPGTLSIPAGKGPFPAVVLVHGSGPQDRDETISAIKVFKDLAEGLASRGIAVLRYEKRTKLYGAQMAAGGSFTVEQETVQDAVRAAALLRAEPEIDHAKIFVLGHSLGGYLAPRIAKQDAKLAGLIILAGSVRPLEEIILEQNTAALTPDQQKQFEAIKQQVEAIKNLDPAKKNPPLIFGLPSGYFLDLKGYSPVALAKSVNVPMLVLQGERDFQVSMKDFELWKAGLANQRRTVFHSYPGLSHLFVLGQGKGSVAEYATPGHVAQQVIDDISAWVVSSK